MLPEIRKTSQENTTRIFVGKGMESINSCLYNMYKEYQAFQVLENNFIFSADFMMAGVALQVTVPLSPSNFTSEEELVKTAAEDLNLYYGGMWSQPDGNFCCESKY